MNFSQPSSGKYDLKVEAVITCVNYGDFLEHTLPENMELLDRVVVVTSTSDKRTQALCQRYGVDCYDTEIWHDEGASFSKGRGINLGISHLRHEGYILHMDADILLPHNFRSMLRRSKLDPKCIYGADRLNISGFDKYIALKNEDRLHPQFQYHCLVAPNGGMSLGSRLVHGAYGYTPIGFFQLWHSSEKRIYPIVHGSAEHSDVLFAVQWPREKRILLPEFFVYHLESEKDQQMGVNWHGRKSKEFGPTVKKEVKVVGPVVSSSEVAQKHHHDHNHHGHHHHHHGHHHHHHPYCEKPRE